MKIIFLLLSASIYCSSLFAQSRLVTAEYQKNNQPGVQNEIPFNEKTVDKSIDDQLLKLGYRGSDTKGYKTFKGVRIIELGPDMYDIYLKTERKSRNEKDVTIVTMLISSGYEKFIGDTTNAQIIENAKIFLQNMVTKVAAFDLEQQITVQDNIEKKSAKKLANIVDDGISLQKKKTKIDIDIADNLKDQSTQKSATDKEQQILKILLDKRKQ